MLFSTVYFPEEIEDVENKLRINLSDFAFSVLNDDIDAFGVGETSDDRIHSSFINDIFFYYKDVAMSSVSLALNIRREELSVILGGLSGNEQIIEKLLAVYEVQLLENAKNKLYNRDKPFSIRVNKRNLEYLRSDEGQAESSYYNDRVGLYFKAVVEEYCQQPYVVREQIFYRDNWNEIIRGVDESKVVKLKLQSKKSEQGRAQDNILYIKPLCVEKDSEHLYNYVAGMIGPTQSGPWKIGAVRLSKIKIAECQNKSGHLSIENKKDICENIKKKGIQYLSDENFARVVVQFSEYGEKMYHQILHLRPKCIKKEESIYEFECPLYQADTYFFKFGHNVKILEPKSLAESFKQKYQAAAEGYK